MRFSQIYMFFLLMIILSSTSCIKEFIPETLGFESLLVVEASINNEYKFHEIRLSRAFKFEGVQNFETDANVRVVDNFENVISFQETEAGHYVSTVRFNVELNKTYRLLITTKDNISYVSKEEAISSNTSQLSDVIFSKNTNSLGEEGVDVLISSFDPLGNSKYYRYEYEETYKIVAPLWGPEDLIIIPNTLPYQVGTQLRTKEERICYNTVFSKTIFQTETNNLTEDRVTDFPLRFISKESPLLRDGYSVKVNQYVQSFEAYSYYKTLNELTTSESLFSENQPGFFYGNITCLTNPNEKVIGFFEVAFFSSKRVFVSFEDLYPNQGRAPYFTRCNIVAPSDIGDGGANTPLVLLIQSNTLKYFDINVNRTEERPGPYLMTQRECSDCTFYGSNIKPDFWID